MREDFILLPLAQASGRYERGLERPSGRKPWRRHLKAWSGLLGPVLTIGWLAVYFVRSAQSWSAQTVHLQYNFRDRTKIERWFPSITCMATSAMTVYKAARVGI